MKFSTRLNRSLLILASLLLWMPVFGQSQNSAAPQNAGALAARMSGFNDEGTFVRYVKGERAGTITFKWQADGAFDNRRQLVRDGEAVTGTTKIIPDKDGRWVKAIVEGQDARIELVREGDVVRVSIQGGTESVALKPGTVLWGPYAPALMSLPVRLYDRAKGGKQIFPVLRLGAGDLVEASLEMTDKVKRSVGGREIEFTRFIYRLPMVDLTLWVDAEAKLYMSESPAEQSALVREGYEALRQEAQASAASQGLKGAWHGVLDVGVAKLRLILRVAQAADGSFSAKLDSPDQMAMGLPVDTITLQDQTVRFEMKAIGGSYEGKFNQEGTEITGQWQQGGQSWPLLFKRGEGVAKANRPQEPKKPYPYDEEEVVYENKAVGVKLAATLTLPRGQGPFPAVLLVTGSGPQDRNETVMGHRPFLVLADHLTRQGIAVLRADDRGVGKSTGNFAAATSEDFASDALAGIEYLKGRKEIHPRQIGLIGHSEGGMIAPMVAVKSPDVAFVVLMAGPGVNGDEIALLQSGLSARETGAGADAEARNRAVVARLVAVLKAEKDDLIAKKRLREIWDEMLAGMTDEQKKAESLRIETLNEYMRSPWFRFLMSYDHRLTLTRLACPVLALIGERDVQVTPKDHLPSLVAALEAGGNRDYTIVKLPQLNHLFQTSRTGSLAEYHAIEETLAPMALETITGWILKHTKR